MNETLRKVISDLEQQLSIANQNSEWHRKQWRIYEEKSLELKLYIDDIQKLAK